MFVYSFYLEQANRHQCAEKIAITQQRIADPSSRITRFYNVSRGLSFSKEQLSKYTSRAQCLFNLRTRLREHCINTLNVFCNNSKIIAYKALRFRMETVKEVLEKVPDTHVVYYVRDPRAIVYSTKKAGLMSVWSGGKLQIEAKYLCEKMRHDLKGYFELSKLYPGAIKMIRYEDLTSEPDRISDELYKFIGVPKHQEVRDWIAQSQNVTKNGNKWSTRRGNWTAGIEKWAELTSHKAGIEMDHYCKDILSILGYSRY